MRRTSSAVIRCPSLTRACWTRVVSRSAAWRAFFFVASPAGTIGGTWWVHSREAPVGRAAAHTTPPTWRRAVAGRSLAPTPGWRCHRRECGRRHGGAPQWSRWSAAGATAFQETIGGHQRGEQWRAGSPARHHRREEFFVGGRGNRLSCLKAYHLLPVYSTESRSRASYTSEGDGRVQLIGGEVAAKGRHSGR